MLDKRLSDDDTTKDKSITQAEPLLPRSAGGSLHGCVSPSAIPDEDHRWPQKDGKEHASSSIESYCSPSQVRLHQGWKLKGVGLKAVITLCSREPARLSRPWSCK